MPTAPSARACVTADEAFAALGVDRTTGYRAIREGTFPLPVVRVGRIIRVPAAALRRLLDPGILREPDEYVDDPAAENPTRRPEARPELAHDTKPTATRSTT